MRALVLRRMGDLAAQPEPLALADVPDPVPGPDEIVVVVSFCGVCHTELDEIEGRTPPPALPVILGHQVVGRVLQAARRGSAGLAVGDRVGVAWIHRACGECDQCRRGRENLCPRFSATGRDVNGGYAERMTVPADFAYQLPDGLADVSAAPLLCAGAIGYRSLRLAGIGKVRRLGLTGFGASGHLMMQLSTAAWPDVEVYVFARSAEQRAYARELGAVWAGDIGERAPELLDAIVDTTPVWTPVVRALENLVPGGRLVVNAIRKESSDKSSLLELDYAEHLWMEKEIKSVANVARRDVAEFLELAATHGLSPEVELYAMEEANRALTELKAGGGRGAKVLAIGAAAPGTGG